MISDPHSDDGPQTHSERLKVDYDQVMYALHRSAKRFSAPGVRSGVPELAVLLGRSENTLAKQLNPTDYDHAPTVHGFLQVLEVLQSREAVEEIAALAGCTTIPAAGRAEDVDAPADLAAAFADFIQLAARNLSKTVARLELRNRLTHAERAEARDALFGLVAYAAHLIHRIRLP